MTRDRNDDEVRHQQTGSLVGRKLSHYEIRSLLGAGGMGDVYLAHDARLGRNAALKILPPAFAANADRMQRFTREARAASALNHPNVATVYDVGEADGVSFIAMEYVEGRTLASRIDDRSLDDSEIIPIGIQIADALAEAHEKGITHRDIKPANIMLTPRGLVKVLDFGLAKSPELEGDGKTTAGIVMGTLQYMSPEQMLGREVDQRTDIFSFGIVLNEMASGRAFPELEPIIRKCSERDRERRYQSAKELLVDLKNLQRATVAVLPRRRGVFFVIAAAIVALAVAAGLYLSTRRDGAGRTIESVAVLPFVNAGADPEMEYLADGITENIINNLSQLSQLKVMSRSSVFRYKGRGPDPQAAGKELNVEAVLIGRVVPHGKRLAINLELIDVSDSRQLWGEQYNPNLDDLIEVQTEISREVSDKLQLRLTGSQQQQLARRPTENGDAYQSYLKGRFYWSKVSEEGFRKAIDFYQQAVEKDPKFAEAYVGIADSYIALGTDYVSPRNSMPQAKLYAGKALAINNGFAEAHSSIGIIKLVYDWDWPGAAEEFRHHLSLSPQSVDSFSCSLHYADPMGRNDEAIAGIKKALALDPSSLPPNLELGCASYYGRHYDESIKQLRETLAMYPLHPTVSFGVARAYVQKKMYGEAISILSEAKSPSGDWPPIVAELGYAYAGMGERKQAQKFLDELKQQASHRYVDPYLLAVVYEGLGDKDRLFTELDNAFAERSTWLPWLKLDPKWDNVHSDPRFTSLVKRVGL
jgi:serine/threonine-protein kinase